MRGWEWALVGCGSRKPSVKFISSFSRNLHSVPVPLWSTSVARDVQTRLRVDVRSDGSVT